MGSENSSLPTLRTHHVAPNPSLLSKSLCDGPGHVAALRDTRCTRACQVDRELMAMRTDLTRDAGWSVAGIQ